MLVIGKKGVYDVPERDLAKYPTVTWVGQKKQITQLFDAVAKVISDSRTLDEKDADVRGQSTADCKANCDCVFPKVPGATTAGFLGYYTPGK
jgi:hypothetical protein